MSTAKKEVAPTSNADQLRSGRISEDRYFDMRDDEITKMLQMGFADPLHIDRIPEGWQYHWARDSFHGEVDTARMTQLQKRGWTPVTAEERLDLVNATFDGRESPLKGYIHYKGLVLVKRPTRFGEIEKEMEHKASYESMISLPVHQDMNSNAARESGWQTKVYQNETSVMKTKTTSFKD